MVYTGREEKAMTTSHRITTTARGIVRHILRNYEPRELEDVFTEQIDDLLEPADARIAELEAALGRLVLAFDVGDMAHATANGRGHAALAEARALLPSSDPPAGKGLTWAERAHDGL